MTKGFEETVKFLETSIPRDEIATRDGGGKKLSYLETWRVIDLMNEAFGNLGWDSETVEMVLIEGTALPTYRAKVRIKALIKVADGQYLNVVKEGYGWGADKSAKHSPHEMAVKEAESDAFKRAAMKFGKRLGLALYDKTQEFVIDETTPKQDAVRGNDQSVLVKGNDGGGKTTMVSPASPVPVQQVAKTTREATNKLISQNSKVILDKKLSTQEKLIALVQGYGVKSKEELTDSDAEKLLNQLREMLK